MRLPRDRFQFRPSSHELALYPRAIDGFFDAHEEKTSETFADESGIATIWISGPLEHHANWLWDSYDDITTRIEEAAAHEDTRAVAMRIDSPGGLAAGATEAQRKIRKISAQYGKPIYAFADEMACSAAYELACGADEIWMPETATVGSVGVILALYDTMESNAKHGVRVELITSGKRKADSHSDRPLTAEIRKVAQERVDSLARIFFQVVADARGTSVGKIAGLQAGVYQGKEAQRVGLADGVAGWDDFLAYVKEQTMTIKSKTKGTAKKNNAGAKSKKPEASSEVELEALRKENAALAARLDRLEASNLRADDDEEDEEAEDEDEDHCEEDEDEEDDKSKSSDEDEDEEDEDEESTSGSTGSTSAKDDADEKSFFGAKSGLYTTARLLRVCRQVTGQRNIRQVFGALDAMGQKIKAAEKQEKRLAKLEAVHKSERVDAMIKSAYREGRISKAQMPSLREKGLADPKFLKGFLAVTPKQVRTREDGELRANIDGEGAPIGAPKSKDQAKLMTAATSGMSEKELALFKEELAAGEKKLNGSAKRF